MEPRATKNGTTSTLKMNSDLGTAKTPITEVSCKSNEFDQLDQKTTLLYKDILANFDVSKIFEIVPDPYVKFDEKHDGDIAEPILLTVLELCLNFVQTWSSEPPKMVPPQF